jgi:hypothetical protein
MMIKYQFSLSALDSGSGVFSSSLASVLIPSSIFSWLGSSSLGVSSGLSSSSAFLSAYSSSDKKF